MKKTTYISIFLFLILSSCTTRKTPDYTFEDVPIIIDMDSVKTDTLKINHIRYIPLETTDECLIGFANKTLIKNNRIYVADYTRAKAIFIFDMNGKFLFKIAQMGQGPREYININDFDVLTNGDIFIFDGFGNKILVFDSNGLYLKDIRMNYCSDKFCFIDNKLYWSKPFDSRGVFACLVTYDLNNKKTEIVFDNKYLYDSKIIDQHPFDFYHSMDSIIYYAPKFSNIVFSIDNDGIRPAIGVKNLKETPKYTIEAWLREADWDKRDKLIMSNRYFTDFAYIFENENYISFTLINERNIILYNKYTKKTFRIPFNSLWDTFGDSLIKGSAGKDFFGVVEFDSEDKAHKKILASREELKNWHEEDNPVVVLFNLDN